MNLNCPQRAQRMHEGAKGNHSCDKIEQEFNFKTFSYVVVVVFKTTTIADVQLT